MESHSLRMIAFVVIFLVVAEFRPVVSEESSVDQSECDDRTKTWRKTAEQNSHVSATNDSNIAFREKNGRFDKSYIARSAIAS
ncbi:hypothetical protein KIN20_019895 [Parelaphostrongylus tenuis]|uniref:Uncharacterized protein n=1 Tax=Parelaphostrongylus tenuis TaxID=148309 RepID=A0AAD5MS65_PARTN|nr:hypothetical protein KIN20_019895 [Parelaphostrongylus tenuis]